MSNESVPFPVLVTTSVKVTTLPWLAELMVSMPLMVASLSLAATPVSLIVTLALWRTVKLKVLLLPFTVVPEPSL